MNDTISAIATAIGTGGIGVIRISGDRAISIADLVFDGPVAEFSSHTVHYGKLQHPDTQDRIDDVLVTVFKSPRSYTGEDAVEISCHGGMEVVRAVLTATWAAGARPAEPGEFTKRAFLNGRLDLAQAEAVNDLIRARTDDSRRVALGQLEGKLSREVGEILNDITRILAAVEASIDFPEDVEEPDYEQVKRDIEAMISHVSELVNSSRRGRVYREGIRMVIVGRPNVGKSSILNALLRESRAIVTPIPGTTRDVIEETINIRGIPVVAVDTAGLRETEDVVERMGVELTEKSLSGADLVLGVIDASAGLTTDDVEVIERVKGRASIVVFNKTDIALSTPQVDVGLPTAAISASTGQGISELEDIICNLILGGKVSGSDGVMVTNERHRLALESAGESLSHAIETIDDALPVDFLSTDLMAARLSLGEITGETASEDLIDRIFRDFCIGK